MLGLRLTKRRRLLRSLRERQLLLEPLEDRRMLSVFTVNSTGDEPDREPGDGKAVTIKGTTTLRAALTEANVQLGKDTIEFNIPGTGPHVIRPATRLPMILDPISIDGYSQPGASPNTQALQDGHDAVIQIELDGSLLPIGSNGLEIVIGQSEVTGLAMYSFRGTPLPPEEFLGTTVIAENGTGIWLWAGGGNIVAGNLLGAKANGLPPANAPSGWSMTSGITIGSSDNVIQENVIVGSQTAGIIIGAKDADAVALNVHSNMIYGNYIGVAQDGETPLPNQTGVLICWGAFGNQVGGDSANFGNLISGNKSTGISIVGLGSGGTYVGANVIQRNRIGTDRNGWLIDPDGKANSGDETGNGHVGIQIKSSPNNVIGGTTADAGNVISGNEGGILIVAPQSEHNEIRHNKIGTDVEGKVALPNAVNGIEIQQAPRNTIKSNLISGNSGTGVRIEGPGATGNLIETNLVGTDATGTLALGNHFGGIDIIKATENVVFRNTISGSQSFGVGVTIDGPEAKNNRVSENRIGTDAAGMKDLGNTGAGVAIVGGSDNTIDGNIISGNDLCGIFVDGATAKRNDVHGNFIGTDITGNAGLKNGLDGIWIQHAADNSIGSLDPASRNIIAGNDRDGVRISGKSAKGNRVLGNYIGTNVVGTTAIVNGGAGVRIVNAPGNVIGGTSANHRNVISGNKEGGVAIIGADASGNVVEGNYIGTNSQGTSGKMGNSRAGVLIEGAPRTVIGGETTVTGAAPGNVISGNSAPGIYIKGTGATQTKVQGNIIGRDANGQRLGNNGAGILIENASRTEIGWTTTTTGPVPIVGKSNIISANKGDGIRIQGNSALRNLIRRNAIYENVQRGINLVGGQEQLRRNKDSVTPNDPGDFDNGANDWMNFPVGVIAWYDGVDTIISGVLDTLNAENATIDIYATNVVDSSGFGEGRYYLGSATPLDTGAFRHVIHGQLGPATIPGFPSGETVFLGATATNANGSTSEFSAVCGDPDGDGSVDSDQDGLPDVWERNGVDINGDDVIDLDLPTLGALWNRKDVFVELDWMDGYKLDDASINAVKTAFRNAPVGNPGGMGTGITLHVNHTLLGSPGDTIPASTTPVPFAKTPAANDDFWDLKNLYFGTALDRVSPNGYNILSARSLVYHYTIVTAAVAGAPGWGELHGDDFVNKKEADWETDAAAFMHELGHNLGLNHGGPMSRDAAANAQGNINYKPNHLSIMNYSYVYLNWATKRPLDYSRYTTSDLNVLDENDLQELVGISFGKPWQNSFNPWNVVYSYPDSGIAQAATAVISGSVDWDHDGEIDLLSSVAANINDQPTKAATGSLQVLQSLEEWDYLRYDFRSGSGFKGVVALPDIEYLIEVAMTLDTDGDGINNADDNVPAIFNPNQLDTDGDGIGDAGELANLVLSSASAADGTQVTGTVTLLLPAPAEGALVQLFSSQPWMVELPRYVVIPPGARVTSFQFPVTAWNLEPTKVVVYASYGPDYVETELTVGPARTTADLSLSMVAAPDPVGLGGVVAYAIDVANHGPQPVTGVTLSDTLPDGAVLKTATGTVRERVPGPGLHVRFDFTYDTNDFFDSQEKRDLLQLAGDIFMSVMGDELDAIVPGAGNTWTAVFPHPAAGAEERITDLVIRENEIVVFVARGIWATRGRALPKAHWPVPAASKVWVVRTSFTRSPREANGAQMDLLRLTSVPGAVRLRSIPTRPSPSRTTTKWSLERSTSSPSRCTKWPTCWGWARPPHGRPMWTPHRRSSAAPPRDWNTTRAAMCRWMLRRSGTGVRESPNQANRY